MTVLRARIDGQPRALADATISVTDDGLLRGDGVFEVLRVYAGRTFALEEHLVRMERSAAGLRLPFNMDATREDARALEVQAPGGDAIIRLLTTRGGRRIALLEELGPKPPSVRLQTVEFSPSGLLDGLKTLSYAANMLAGRQAEEAGADRALLVKPGGEVLEGPTFAIFFGLDDDGPLVTPPLASGILDSITRRRLLEHIPAVERAVHIDELRGLREAFVTSTLLEVTPVSAIDGRPAGSVPGPRTSFAAERFAEILTRPRR